MNLVAPTRQMIQAMMSWINNEQELTIWAGPGFRYPFTEDSFCEDLRLNELASFCMVGDGSSVLHDPLAFGQFYHRLNRCHLGRLIVAPSQRGKGLVQHLITFLSELGNEQLDVRGESLFVLTENLAAIQAYTKLGFGVVEYPEQNPLEDCFYMVRD